MHLAKILHAIFGIDHYPRYLLKWRVEDIDQLETQLESVLAKVRQEKNILLATQHKIRQFTPTVPAPLCDSNTALLGAVCDPQFTQLMQLVAQQNHTSTSLTIDKLIPFLEFEADGVVSLPLLSPSFCQRLVAEGQRFTDFAKTSSIELPFGVVPLNLMHMEWLTTQLLNHVIGPLSSTLFAEELHDGTLDWAYGYVIGYVGASQQQTQAAQSQLRNRLVVHSDDSEVTLNVCLSDGFEGGELILQGHRGTVDEGAAQATYTPKLGRAVLHSGRYLHEVAPVRCGSRQALIVWARCYTATRAQLCPCCWINRRTPANSRPNVNCICGPSWN
eukprot:c12911_g1_i5.p1 GENE.c12911_g1_i5~~c12911_g1_i5.p1  ORF type:complete len:331 (-),score=68.29 c12911_g1_i5:70-1062(-)